MMTDTTFRLIVYGTIFIVLGLVVWLAIKLTDKS